MRRTGIILFVIALSGCIDPIRLEIETGAGTLVVDGLITNLPGPYVVRLSRSINFDNSRPLRVYPIHEVGATVQIFDDTGASETLVERTPGAYETTMFQGEVGRSYHIVIETSNGEVYTSKSEKMAAPVNIRAIEQEFAVYDRLFINANGQPRIAQMEGFYIYAIPEDPADSDNFYRWQADGIFEFFSLTNNPTIKQCWAPLTRLEDRLTVTDDVFFNGQAVKQFVCIVPYDRPTWFLVKLRQESLTSEAYLYWKRAGSQQVATGSLFDSPPSPNPGNVSLVTNSEERALGFFRASAVINFELLFNRLKESGFLEPAPHKLPQPGDCRTQEPLATNIKPAGF